MNGSHKNEHVRRAYKVLSRRYRRSEVKPRESTKMTSGDLIPAVQFTWPFFVCQKRSLFLRLKVQEWQISLFHENLRCVLFCCLHSDLHGILPRNTSLFLTVL